VAGWTSNASKPDRFGWFGCSWSLLRQLASSGRERGFRHAINDDFLAYIVVVASIADVEIRLVALWSRSHRNIFPVTILGAVDAEDAEGIAATVEAVDEWTTAGIVVRPKGVRSLAGRNESTTFGNRSVFDGCDRYGWTIAGGLWRLLTDMHGGRREKENNSRKDAKAQRKPPQESGRLCVFAPLREKHH
jgi:hypothetical protein